MCAYEVSWQAYLAYGTHNRVKSASILKVKNVDISIPILSVFVTNLILYLCHHCIHFFQAAYNVGGQCINACVIQSSILGIRSHYSEPVCLSL